MTKSKLTAPQVIPGVTVLTESHYETLLCMLRSNDEADHLMAQQILAPINVEKSIFWIWKLANLYSSRMVNQRTKIGREFRDRAHLFFIAHKNATEFGSWLIKQGWMTDEIYMRIKDELIEHEKRTTHSKFYQHTIELKDTLKHLDPNAKPVLFNNQDGD